MNRKIREFTLPNGWVVVEMQHQSKNVFVGQSINSPDIGRFTASLFRCPALRVLKVSHFIGATAKDRDKTMRSAMKAAKGRSNYMSGHWNRFYSPSWAPGKYVYRVTIGEAVNETEAFEQLTKGLFTVDEIDQQFRSLIEEYEVTP